MNERPMDIAAEIDQRWSSLTIADDFVFGKVMLDEGICRRVLEAILRVEIDHVEYIGRQEPIDVTSDSKGVRLDVYVRDDAGTVYNVEMQAVNTRELPRRARYYQAVMALDQIEKGEPYRTLKDAYVIFVCGFDLFGQGRRVYSFQSRCSEDCSLTLDDGAHVVFLSAPSPEDPSVGADVNELLDYIGTGQVTGELSSQLETAVRNVLRSEDCRLEYMMLAVRDQLNVEKGREIGLQLGLEQGRAEGLRDGLARGKEEGLRDGLARGKEEGLRDGLAKGKEEGLRDGLARGKAEGENRFAKLVSALIAADRADELTNIASDAASRETLYKEFGITK